MFYGNYQLWELQGRLLFQLKGVSALWIYAAALEHFKAAGNIEEVKAKQMEANYLLGTELLRSGDYEDAADCFFDIPDYKNANDIHNVCVAEQELEDGNMFAAIAAYDKVPKNLSIDGFNAIGCKTLLEKNRKCANISGE